MQYAFCCSLSPYLCTFVIPQEYTIPMNLCEFSETKMSTKQYVWLQLSNWGTDSPEMLERPHFKLEAELPLNLERNQWHSKTEMNRTVLTSEALTMLFPLLAGSFPKHFHGFSLILSRSHFKYTPNIKEHSLSLSISFALFSFLYDTFHYLILQIYQFVYCQTHPLKSKVCE